MKKVIYATLLLLLLCSPTVSAHTSLTNLSPADGEVVKEEIHEVVLEYNIKIESTSTVKVINEKSEEIVGTTQVSDNVMTIGFIEPLDNGTYTVEWKIIGADGHPIQGIYSFDVRQEDVNDFTESVESDETLEIHTEEQEAVPEENLVENQEMKQVEATSKFASNDVLVVILVVLFTIAGGIFGWIIGRRQK